MDLLNRFKKTLRTATLALTAGHNLHFVQCFAALTVEHTLQIILMMLTRGTLLMLKYLIVMAQKVPDYWRSLTKQLQSYKKWNITTYKPL